MGWQNVIRSCDRQGFNRPPITRPLDFDFRLAAVEKCTNEVIQKVQIHNRKVTCVDLEADCVPKALGLCMTFEPPSKFQISSTFQGVKVMIPGCIESHRNFLLRCIPQTPTNVPRSEEAEMCWHVKRLSGEQARHYFAEKFVW